MEAAREHIDKNSLSTVIEIDGGIDESNARRLVSAGVDILVIGSAFFGAYDRGALTEKVQGMKR